MSYNPVPINHSVADLMMEVEEQFCQVMNPFMEAGRTRDTLRYDRAVTRGISGFNKAKHRCYTISFRALKHIEKNKVKKMEEKVNRKQADSFPLTPSRPAWNSSLAPSTLRSPFSIYQDNRSPYRK